jgi:hypothetical protein
MVAGMQRGEICQRWCQRFKCVGSDKSCTWCMSRDAAVVSTAGMAQGQGATCIPRFGGLSSKVPGLSIMATCCTEKEAGRDAIGRRVVSMAVRQVGGPAMVPVATKRLRENGCRPKLDKRRCRCETREVLVCKRVQCLRNDALLRRAAA